MAEGPSRRELLLAARKRRDDDRRGSSSGTTTSRSSTTSRSNTSSSTTSRTSTSSSSSSSTTPAAPPAEPPRGVLDVWVNEGHLPMVDGTLVYHRGYGERPGSGGTGPQAALTLPTRVVTRAGDVVASRLYPLDAVPPPAGLPAPARPDPEHVGQFLVRRRYWASYLPERTLVLETGGTLRLRLHNTLAAPHELAVVGAGPGGSTATTGLVDPGATGELELPAPAPGTYVFCDRGNAPVERVLGLFGVLLVVDPDVAWTPYPGGPEFERQWVWMCHDVDPVWARAASRGETVDPVRTPAVPRYFLLNGYSGFQSLGVTRDRALNRLRHEDTLIAGFPRQVDVRDFGRTADGATAVLGQLLRLVNPGIVKHQLHFHGNHVWTVWRNGTLFPRRGGYLDAAGHVVAQQWEDTVELNALDRKDSVIPVKRPPDAMELVWRNRSGPWRYPMHCHAEPSQTAGGGLYPGGLVADWTLAGPAEGAS